MRCKKDNIICCDYVLRLVNQCQYMKNSVCVCVHICLLTVHLHGDMYVYV